MSEYTLDEGDKLNPRFGVPCHLTSYTRLHVPSALMMTIDLLPWDIGLVTLFCELKTRPGLALGPLGAP